MRRGTQGWLAAGLTIAIALCTTGTAAGSNSAATITGSFGDSCRDFTAHSTKDISHVVVRYADGRSTKDESTGTAHYSIDGGAEISSVDVKSGTTTRTFTCTRAGAPPTALLEVQTPDDSACGPFFESGLQCDQHAPRTVWRDSGDFPTDPSPSGSTAEAGNLVWGCDGTSGPCSFSFDFRGTGSGDPDNDIVSWSIDFDDGTSASGSWSLNPPAAVSHAYDPSGCGTTLAFHCVVTLTVTDATGQSDTDTITMAFVDQTPD